jgi:site-specific DNA-methyltransferase (adenine-specific)
MKHKQWDKSVPTDEYLLELWRVSKNRIIWGGNYFDLPAHRCFIVWDKMTYIPTMSQVEMAYTSFDTPARYVKINSNDADRIHPTQKPVKLYKWILHNYAKPGDRILDTHLGSGSSAIAAHNMGFDFVGTEIDLDYYNDAVKRFNQQTMQLKLL